MRVWVYVCDEPTCITLGRDPTTQSFGWVKPVLDVQKYGWMGSLQKIIDIVSYALEMSVNSITFVCSPFQVKKIHYQIHM